MAKKRIDWAAIQAEYIGGNIGQKRLAREHGIAANTLQKRAKMEGWHQLKLKARAESGAKAVQQFSDLAAENAGKAERIRAQLLDRLSALTEMALSGTENRGYDDDGRLIEIRRLKDLTGAYKDLAGGLSGGDAGDDAIARARDVLEGLESAIG
ncbi:MAG: hypothetical protein II008_16475 [Oscillospiraceae bacterium]|nr:hypothetical protein [Oscillospiraceae bacterium]